MKKFFLLFFVLIFALPAFALKIPVRITPTQIISTHSDEIETGDWLKFEIVNDVYVNDKIYLKKQTPIYGFVDFFHPNGWAGDKAEIKIKTFETRDINDEKVTINYPLDIKENKELVSDTKEWIIEFISEIPILSNIIFVIRGSEIYIEPDTNVFNIFIER